MSCDGGKSNIFRLIESRDFIDSEIVALRLPHRLTVQSYDYLRTCGIDVRHTVAIVSGISILAFTGVLQMGVNQRGWMPNKKHQS